MGITLLTVSFLLLYGSCLSSAPHKKRRHDSTNWLREDSSPVNVEVVEKNAEIEAFIKTLGCSCVNSKCHCESQFGQGRTLSSALEDLLRHKKQDGGAPKSVVRGQGVRQDITTSHRGQVRIEDFASALGCECVSSHHCLCNGELLSKTELSAILRSFVTFVEKEEETGEKEEELAEEELATYQESLGTKIRKFFHDGFKRLKKTFTNHPHQ